MENTTKNVELLTDTVFILYERIKLHAREFRRRMLGKDRDFDRRRNSYKGNW